MTDNELLDGLETCTLPPDAFGHREHVRAAFLYLRAHPLPEALARFERTLRRYAEHQGAARKFHVTITYAFMFLINERLARAPIACFDELAARHPELLAWPNALLSELYGDAILGSDVARTTFVLPAPTSAHASRPDAAVESQP